MQATTIKKYSNTSTSKLLNKAQKIFNEYIRLRDSDANGNFVCISCGKLKPKSQLQAGHYFPVGQNQALRFDERNGNGECLHCNYYSGQHLIGYRKNLIRKIGEPEFKKLEMDMLVGKRGHKWDRFSIIEIIEKYKEEVKELRKTKNG